jgi:hypothetical protein
MRARVFCEDMKMSRIILAMFVTIDGSSKTPPRCDAR